MPTTDMRPKCPASFQDSAGCSARSPLADIAMVSRRTIAFFLSAACIVYGSTGLANAAETDLSKTAGGVTVYLGVVPAEIVKGLPASSSDAERTMHGHVPKGPH